MRAVLSSEEYDVVARAADFALTPNNRLLRDAYTPRELNRRRCKAWLELDRQLWAVEKFAASKGSAQRKEQEQDDAPQPHQDELEAAAEEPFQTMTFLMEPHDASPKVSSFMYRYILRESCSQSHPTMRLRRTTCFSGGATVAASTRWSHRVGRGSTRRSSGSAPGHRWRRRGERGRRKETGARRTRGCCPQRRESRNSALASSVPARAGPDPLSGSR